LPPLRGAVHEAAASTALLGLETIRLGLRADTLECFENLHVAVS
jgi:hypothetical protein